MYAICVRYSNIYESRLQNNTVYELQRIQLFSTNKPEHDRKLTQTSCASTKLQPNYKRSFNKTIANHLCKKNLYAPCKSKKSQNLLARFFNYI